MIEKSKINLENLVKQFPDLKNKALIKILVTFGSFHTSLAQRIKKLGYKTTKEFSLGSYKYAFMHEIMRRYQYGKEIDREMVARAILENFIYKEIDSISRDTDKKYIFARKVAVRLSKEDIEKISKAMAEGKDFKSALADFGIAIPTTEEELESV